MCAASSTPSSQPLQLSFEFARPRLRLHLRAYWQAAAERVGCACPEEAIVQTYRRTRSIAKTAAILNFSDTTIRNKLHLLDEPVQAPGGNNNPWGRAGNPQKDLSPLF